LKAKGIRFIVNQILLAFKRIKTAAKTTLLKARTTKIMIILVVFV